MKVYKKIQAAFGGAGLYLDKRMLRALDARCGDELVITIEEGKLVISKSKISNKQIEELLNADRNLKKGV